MSSAGRYQDIRQDAERICENTLWLYESGVHPTQWPERVGSPSMTALASALRKEGHNEAASAIDRALSGPQSALKREGQG